MKTTHTPTNAAINIMTSNLADNETGAQAARRIANDTWDQMMSTTTRPSLVKHRQPAKVKVPAPAKGVVNVKPASSPALIKQLENELDLRLQSVAHELLAKFDLSPETAKANSYGTKHFKAHNLLSKSGKAKTGAHQSKEQRVLIDRYISYRVGDYAFKLVCLLLNDRDPKGVRFQVEGDPKLLKNDFKTPKELRPYLTKADNMGAGHGGEEFSSFDKAAVRFKWVIGKVAPRLH